jgi:hypothetical protein
MAYVYILQNKEVQRIKIGATLNHPNDRLVDIARMWRSFKGRCPICLNWRMLNKGILPRHVLSGNHCSGSGELPLERSTHLAEKQLIDLQERLPQLRGRDLNYATKRIKNLLKVLQNYKENPVRLGKWELITSYKTDSAYLIEKVVHKALATHLDKTAPFGEVFLCSVDEAVSVIEEAIKVHGD